MGGNVHAKESEPSLDVALGCDHSVILSAHLDALLALGPERRADENNASCGSRTRRSAVPWHTLHGPADRRLDSALYAVMRASLNSLSKWENSGNLRLEHQLLLVSHGAPFPTGEILVTMRMSGDDANPEGELSGYCVSKDGGQTWAGAIPWCGAT